MAPDQNPPSPTNPVPEVTLPESPISSITPQPQNASAPIVPAGPPEQVVKKKRKTWLLGLVTMILLLSAVGSLSINSKDNPLHRFLGPGKITAKYDSPIGLLPPFQQQTVKSGKFKITSSYVTGNVFSREGTFFVDSQGNIDFEMLPDIQKVNELLQYLYTDKGTNPSAYKESIEAATRNFKYDFQSLMGYQGLYSQTDITGGLIPIVESVKNNTADQSTKNLVNISSSCLTSLAAVKTATSTALNTVDLDFSQTKQGANYKATPSADQLSKTNQAELTFLNDCFKPDPSGLIGQETKRLEANKSQAPDITYSQSNGRWHLVYNSNSSSSNDLSKPDITFDVWNISNTPADKKGASASFSEHSNLYGLDYSLCRVVPVVTQDFGYSYSFMAEEFSYSQPSSFDSGYYCTTNQATSNYSLGDRLSISVPNSPAIVNVTGSGIDKLRALHDLDYEIEQFYVQKGHYPSLDEISTLTNNLGDLKAAAQEVLSAKALTFSFTPSGCTNNCTSYAQSYKVGQATFTHAAYSSP